MVLAAKAIASGVEGNMGWSMRHSRGMRSEKAMANNFFRELMASPDVLFVGIFGPSGQMLLASEEMERFSGIPEEGLLALQQHGQWHAFSTFNGQHILLFARRARPILARHFLDTPPPSLHEHLPPDKRPFLILGLNMSEQLAMYQDSRRAALWQTGYILGTAAILGLVSLTLLKRREQGRRVTELERFQSKLLDNLPDGLLTLDCENVIRSANPAAIAILGRNAQLAGMNWADLPLCRTLEKPTQKEPDIFWNQYTFEKRSLEILTVPLREDCVQIDQTLVLVRDRTRIKNLETSLQDAQRLAAIGRLAAALAHEIRNPLSALRGFAQYFASKLIGQEPEQTYARTMVSEADRLNRVITDLLFLSKPRSPEPHTVPLGEFFSEIRNLVHLDLLGYKAAMDQHLAVQSVWADQDLLKQAVLNLVMNALEALPEQDGMIRIGSTPGLSMGSGPETMPEGQGTWIFVEDNGKGMDGEQREKALEPFYTTRKDGAGLGLAIVHKIMHDHGGQMEILSSPGAGTRVSLFFPEKSP